MNEPSQAVIYQILSRTEEQNATMDHLVFEMMQFPGAAAFTKNELLFGVYWLETYQYIFRSTEKQTTRYYRTPKGHEKLVELEVLKKKTGFIS
ncbi:DUF3116 family protein [Listeria swaminathanii]|uniref:DUF3116 family protein n=1 Tax=Listeria swaminathanii TaxID=2713501 RepID=A0A7X0ZYM8_9LIST|nr:DUF3116 family protein [Listeria swaminathanii]MCD2246608.1 DUF3116 family protein [Listeria marthii]MBC2328793.1 DUF3116 family protein [Listeria swaminathanii]MDT0015936.1 DUF3116 family protein [Listeria swaminathanii]MDT0021372.1 DUF3116 family protein [Listeria swaminathanii]MDT0032336.1 DUF3116 family protein [Listeria swaminathanii]